MSSNKIIKRKLFKRYVNNFNLVASHFDFKDYEVPKDLYICPLCFKTYSEDDLKPDDRGNSLLTLEHNPLRSLGGKGEVLTCRDCNNKAGEQIDDNLFKFFSISGFLQFNPGTETKLQLMVGNKIYHNVKTRLGASKKIEFLFNEQDLEEIINNEEFIKKPDFQIKAFGHKKSLPEISLLKIAYLKAFSTLGYVFLYNRNLEQVTQQIMYPNKDILPKSWIFSDNLPEEHIGIHIIKSPSVLRAFLVVFSVHHNSIRKVYGVLLPGYSAPGISIYDSLSEWNGRIDLELEQIPCFDYISHPEDCIKALKLWFQYQ